MKKKSVVLLSAGLDSTVNLFWAAQETDVLLALTFNYGQRAALKEIESAKRLTQNLKINHQVIELPWFKDFNKSSLIQKDLEVPQGKSVEIDSQQTSIETMKSVWVPNRNGIFLNIAAGFAEALDADFVVPGFNFEEASTFPDNSEAYLQELNRSFSYSTRNKVQVQCWTTAMNKTEIVQKGIELKVPFKNIWPCYFGEVSWCGQCESCQRSLRALKNAGVQI